MVLQKDYYDTVDGICEQQWNITENGNNKNAFVYYQKETVGISTTQNEKRGFREFYIHRAY